MTAVVRFILHYPRVIIVAALLISIPSAYFSARLYGNLKPDMEELLPRQSRSILDLEEIRSRLKSVQRLAILVYSADKEGSRRFVDTLAQRLEALPRSEIASVEYRIKREIQFFSDRKSLFIDSHDLLEIKKYIASRIDYEKELYNPLNIFRQVEIPEPQYDFEGFRRRHESQASNYSRFPDGYYATPDEQKRLILVYLPAEKSGVKGINSFKKTIQGIIDELEPAKFAQDLQIRFTGSVQDTIEEFTALTNDIETSAQIVFTIVLMALLAFFRSFLATGALLLSLFMARFWTFGVSWFVVGSLNANSAFMGSIVLGSGITYGVMLLSRYLEERRNGQSSLEAGHLAMMGTARATWTAALAAGLAYGSLYFTEFEGFKQYGIMGFMGMVLCWISSIIVLPALLIELERWRSLVKPGTTERSSWIFGPVTRLIDRHPRALLGLSMLMTIFSIAHLTSFSLDEVLEKNLANLRSKASMTAGSGFYGKDSEKILGSASSPLVVLAHDQKYAQEIAKRLREKQKSDGQNSTIDKVNDIQTFIPAHQQEKIEILKELDRILPSHYRQQLSSADRSKVKELLNPAGFDSISEENLPEIVKSKFSEKNGEVGRLVTVEAKRDSYKWSGQRLNSFVNDVRSIADGVEGVKVPVAGTITVTSDMIASIIRDGPRASLIAFLSVVALIIVLFPKFQVAGLMLGALLISNIWLMGIILAAGIKINFLNFIALPITFGIGIDYAVNVFDRYRFDPQRDILRVVRETGGAVGLCSFTTIVGYSSLLIAQNQAFVSFGAVAVLGEITSMLASVIALPSFLLLRERAKAKKKANQTDDQSDPNISQDSDRQPFFMNNDNLL